MYQPHIQLPLKLTKVYSKFKFQVAILITLKIQSLVLLPTLSSMEFVQLRPPKHFFLHGLATLQMILVMKILSGVPMMMTSLMFQCQKIKYLSPKIHFLLGTLSPQSSELVKIHFRLNLHLKYRLKAQIHSPLLFPVHHLFATNILQKLNIPSQRSLLELTVIHLNTNG